MRIYRGALIGAAVASMLDITSDARATLPGIVSVPWSACSVNQYAFGEEIETSGWTFCPFFSYSPVFFGHSVATIYIDGYVYGSGFYSTGCDQSWTGVSLACNSWSYTSATGEIHLATPGFASISGGNGSLYDYYFVELWDGGQYDLLGASFQ
jgi:hypothetical protein